MINTLLLEKPWRELRWWPAIDSTQLEARRRLAAGEDLRGVILWAGEQTAGHGRQASQWASPAGGLYMTACLPLGPPPRAELTGWLTALASLGAIEILEKQLGLRAMLKWPNDIFMDGRKMAGLIGEIGAGEQLLIGMGMNWTGDVRELDTGHGFYRAASLGEFYPGLKPEMRRGFIEAWAGAVARMQRRLNESPEEIVPELQARAEEILFNRNEMVTLTRTEQGDVQGMLLGLTNAGGARVRKPDGEIVEVHCGWQRPG